MCATAKLPLLITVLDLMRYWICTPGQTMFSDNPVIYMDWLNTGAHGCIMSTSTLSEACQDLASQEASHTKLRYSSLFWQSFLSVRAQTLALSMHPCKIWPCKESSADSGAVACIHQQPSWTGALGHACICNICSKLKDFINDNAVIYDMCIKTKDTIDDSAVCYDTNSTHGIAEMKYNVRTTRCLLTSFWVPMH